MLLHASVESGICARKAWGSRLQKARTATNVRFHLLSQATLRAFLTSLRDTASRKNPWTVMFIKHVYETACKETWSVATPLIAADYSDHTGFFRRESVLLLHSRTSDFSAGTLNATCYSIGWHGSGLPDLFAVGTSTGGNSHWNKLELFHKSTSLDINEANGIRYILYGTFGLRPQFWLSFSNSVRGLLSVCVCVCVSSVCGCVGLAF